MGISVYSPAVLRGGGAFGASQAGAGCLAFAIDLIDLIDASRGEAIGLAVRSEMALRVVHAARGHGLRLHCVDNDKLVLHFEGPGSDRLERVAALIVAEASAMPVTTASGVIHVTLSAGGATGPVADLGARKAESLALAALASAQRIGGSSVRVLAADGGLADWYVRATHTLDRVRGAVREGAFVFAHQPVVDRGGGILYHECLLRGVGDEGGLFSPSEFVPVLEQLGTIGWFDHFVVGSVLAELDRDERAVLGCNVSGQSIGCAGWMTGTLDRLALRPDLARRLIIEITETAAIFDLAKAAEHVARLRALGVRVALDDFGVGFASFAHLRALGVDIVKIDKSFLGAAAGVGAIDRVAHLGGLLRGLGVGCVVAEGVEGEGWRQLFELSDISHFQGFSFGVPSTYRGWCFGDAAATGCGA